MLKISYWLINKHILVTFLQRQIQKVILMQSPLTLIHRAISTYNADETYIVLDHFHIKILHIRWTASENEITFWKKWPSHLRVNVCEVFRDTDDVFLSGKYIRHSSSTIILRVNNDIATNLDKIAEIFNDYYASISE